MPEQKTGKLRVFFSYAPGTGKTKAMLHAARRAKEAGADVLIGCLASHHTPQLAGSLSVLPPRMVSQRGRTAQAFDLDAALRIHPGLLAVDELAAVNPDGCRHIFRYQDVEELIHAGIDVYTTLSVQNIESLHDVVAAITGIGLRERVPDSVFDHADMVEFVDIEPEELLRRNQGQPEGATPLFSREVLIALREIALRRIADRVQKAGGEDEHRHVRYRTGEHILICLSGSPSNARVIRTAARMADAFHGLFTALYVDTGERTPLDDRLRENIRLAEQLGARIDTVYGGDIARQIAEYSKDAGVTKIVIGRSSHRRSIPGRNFMERLIRQTPQTDIYIIPDVLPSEKPPIPLLQLRLSGLDLLKTLGIVAVTTLLACLFTSYGLTEGTAVALYILGVLVTSTITEGRACGLIATVLSVLSYSFFVTVPRFTFVVRDPDNLLAFLIMLVVSLLGSAITTRARRQARESSQKASRTQILLETSRMLQRADSLRMLFEVAAGQVQRLLKCPVRLYPYENGALGEPIECGGSIAELDAEPERAAALWCGQNAKHAGATTETFPELHNLYMAVRGGEEVHAVVGIRLRSSVPDAYVKNLLVAILDECALALDRKRSSDAERRVSMQAQQEKLRADFLRAISHDLRTPLTSISGSASVLMESGGQLGEEKRQAMYADIYDDSMWLYNLVENLLSITRIDREPVGLKTESELVDEIIQDALHHVSRHAAEHTFCVELPDEVLMVCVDARLIIQVIVNLVDNAIKYTPPGSVITVSAKREGENAVICIADNGPGIAEADRAHLFEMFYTAPNHSSDSRRGLGLGLALCRSIVGAHGGTISASVNSPHGAVFRFTLPIQEVPVHE